MSRLWMLTVEGRRRSMRGCRQRTVANAHGTVLEQVPNPRPLDAVLSGLRQASRARSRWVKGSRRYLERTAEISRLHRRVNDVRTHHLHVLITRLAQTHGRIVVEGLDATGMLRQKVREPDDDGFESTRQAYLIARKM